MTDFPSARRWYSSTWCHRSHPSGRTPCDPRSSLFLHRSPPLFHHKNHPLHDTFLTADPYAYVRPHPGITYLPVASITSASSSSKTVPMDFIFHLRSEYPLKYLRLCCDHTIFTNNFIGLLLFPAFLSVHLIFIEYSYQHMNSTWFLKYFQMSKFLLASVFFYDIMSVNESWYHRRRLHIYQERM